MGGCLRSVRHTLPGSQMSMTMERIPFTGGLASLHIFLNWRIILDRNLVSRIHIIVIMPDLLEENFSPFRRSVSSKLLLTWVPSEFDLSVCERPAPEFFLERMLPGMVEACEHVENRDDERVHCVEQ